MSRIEYRPYESRDEHAILALFRESFDGRIMALDYWRWRFRDNPVGQVLIELAWDREKLVGHYAVSPVRMSIQGKDRLCGLSMTTMTHPDYRGKGLFPDLADRLYRRMAELGHLMVWGFPNKNSHEGFIKKLGWQDICQIPMLRLHLKDVADMSAPTANVTASTDFDDRLDRLWSAVAPRHDIAVKRDANYLRWRFLSNPENNYHLLCYKDEGQLLGYAVWKLYHARELEIVDLLAEDDESVGAALVKAAVGVGLRLGAESIKMWLTRSSPLHANLERMGFREEAPLTSFGARALNSLPTQVDWSAERAWLYSMSDSDVF
jgi:GNAT superfamily N-acetyltransferase